MLQVTEKKKHNAPPGPTKHLRPQRVQNVIYSCDVFCIVIPVSHDPSKIDDLVLKEQFFLLGVRLIIKANLKSTPTHPQ